MLLPRHAPDAFAYLVSMEERGGGLIRIDGNSATGKFVDEDSAATGATVVEAGEHSAVGKGMMGTLVHQGTSAS